MKPIPILRLTAPVAGGMLCAQPEPAMIVTVFRSRLMPDVREEYVALVERMVELAAAMPGYISHKGFFAEDGERVTIVEFESEEAQRAWRMHPEHREAQKKARETYYQAYSIQICEVKRATSFDRGAQTAAAE
jgi:heme-degrading monooxygenase HmoA